MEGDLKHFERILNHRIEITAGVGKSRPSTEWLQQPVEPLPGHDVEFLNRLFFQDDESEADEMAGPTREEVDAKLAASEARVDTKYARLEGKLDQMLERLQGMSVQMQEVRNDGRSTRANLWAVCAIIVGVIVGAVALLVAVAPAAFTAGSQIRDMVQKEVQSQQTPPKAP